MPDTFDERTGKAPILDVRQLWQGREIMHKGLLHKYAGLFGLAPTDEDVRIGIQARCSILEGATSCGRKSLRTLRGLSKKCQCRRIWTNAKNIRSCESGRRIEGSDCVWTSLGGLEQTKTKGNTGKRHKEFYAWKPQDNWILSQSSRCKEIVCFYSTASDDNKIFLSS